MSYIILTLEYIRRFVNAAIAIIILIPSFSLCGYAMNIPQLYTWNSTPMAINTATCLLLIGITLAVIFNLKNILRK
jgi:hypothetical protein